MVVWKSGRDPEQSESSTPAPQPVSVGAPLVDHVDKGSRLELLNATRAKQGLPPIELGTVRIKRE